MKNQDDKVEIRLRIPKWHRDILEEYCKLYGTSPSAAFCGYIWDVLGRFLVKSLTRADILSKNINIYSIPNTHTKNKNSENEKHSTISENFSPPRSISEEFGIDHQLALEVFVDWAKSHGHEKADWIAAFRNACRTWIKERLPEKKVDEWEGIKRL